MNLPRVLVAGLRGGSGKTIISLGIVGAWRKQGHTVAPFKKGPDYIDAAWLSSAAARPCRNLDLYMHTPDTIVDSFIRASTSADISVIEGNRGLFDGMDVAGSCSTAELAKLLGAPVILVVDCTKVTRTVAAMILGCQQLDPGVAIRGVVLNRIAGPRHRGVLEDAIGEICGLPVVGAVPRLSGESFPERHLGLVPPPEHKEGETSLESVIGMAEEYLDLETIWSLADNAPPLEGASVDPADDSRIGEPVVPIARIGVFRDAAFQFYYPENLEALLLEGAELIDISPLTDQKVPEVDALYLGGGFPETLAPTLAGNDSFKRSLHQKVESGLPVYAECGGAVYLGRSLYYEGSEFPMAGILPIDFTFSTRPRGHGYVELETVSDNPFFAPGETHRGHEFHYTGVEGTSYNELLFAFRVLRGHGFDGKRDGLCYRNVLATYTHLHALGSTTWAPALVRAATRYRSVGNDRTESTTGKG
ncbi:cobyrinate a,c-diamide synthase [Gemmatimonadota bacterium]